MNNRVWNEDTMEWDIVRDDKGDDISPTVPIPTTSPIEERLATLTPRKPVVTSQALPRDYTPREQGKAMTGAERARKYRLKHGSTYREANAKYMRVYRERSKDSHPHSQP